MRRASSAFTRYVPFKEGTTKFDMEFAVFGHKTASDTKAGNHIEGTLTLADKSIFRKMTLDKDK
ncbi:MAG TPA: hypothetical protein VJP02_17480 [Candidatus Sulfotelmatobacter sp.]|nr:hypothetical protein [Candidatus Sulfotelmatobacter sp.]